MRALDAQPPRADFSLYVAWSRIDRSEWFQLLTDPANASSRVSKVLHQGLGATPSRRGLPERLVKALCAEVGIWADMKCGDLAKPFREKLLDALVHWELPVEGHLGCAPAGPPGHSRRSCCKAHSWLAVGFATLASHRPTRHVCKRAVQHWSRRCVRTSTRSLTSDKCLLFNFLMTTHAHAHAPCD